MFSSITFCLITTLFLIGCSINPEHIHAQKHGAGQIEKSSSIYIIVNNKDDGSWIGIAGEIKTELEKNGYKSSYGELIDKPEDASYYIKYNVGWGVDFLFVYIRKLDIKIYDQENKIVAEGEYVDKNFLHRVPRSADIVKLIIKDIFEK